MLSAKRRLQQRARQEARRQRAKAKPAREKRPKSPGRSRPNPEPRARPAPMGVQQRIVPTAVSVVANRLRADVLARLSRSLRRRKRIPPADFSLPFVREHGFAKVSGKRPVDISLSKTRTSVRSRWMRDGESFYIHTHPSSPEPSFKDLANLVERMLYHGPIPHIIYVVNSDYANRAFRRAFLKTIYKKGPGGNPVPKVSKTRARTIIMQEAGKAVEKIVIVAGVRIAPSQALRRLCESDPKGAKQLINFVRSKADDMERYYRNGARIEGSGFNGPRTLSGFNADVESYLELAWGKGKPLFRIQYKSRPGFEYDRDKATYVKA